MQKVKKVILIAGFVSDLGYKETLNFVKDPFNWRKIKEKVKKHNNDIKEKGYSFVFGTEIMISKSKITQKQLEELISNEEILNKELSYPQHTPKITFRNNEKQIEVSSVNELYEYTFSSEFKEIEFAVCGSDSKVINLSLSSDVSVFTSWPSANTLTISSSDEAWTNLTSERIIAKLKKYESSREIFNNWLVKTIFYLILPIGTVYIFSRLLVLVFNYTSLLDEFSLFLSILTNLFVFFFSMVGIYDNLFQHLVGGTLLQDQISNKHKFWITVGWTLTLGVLSTIVWEVIRSIPQLLRLY